MSYRVLHAVEGTIPPGQRVLVKGLCTTVNRPPGPDVRPAPYRGVAVSLAVGPSQRDGLIVSARQTDFVLSIGLHR
jgi:hypothetical protein